MHWTAAIALLIVTALSVTTGAWKINWHQFEFGRQLRKFILLLATVMVWFVVTLDHNAYFNQGFFADRLILLTVLALFFWRPIFIFPLLIVTYMLFWQLAEPRLNNGSHFAHKLQVLHVLNLFAAWFLLHAHNKKYRLSHFIFLTGCLVASAYWVPAFKKILIGWLYEGELFTMHLNAYAHGWLSFLEPQTIVKISSVTAIFEWPMRVFVLVIEAACILFFWKRRFALFLLTSLCVFHLGVFYLFGYFFWTWILLNIAFISLLLRVTSAQHSVFTPPYLVLGVVLIFSAKIWCNPASLAWIDGRLTYTYRFVAVGESQTQYQLPFDYFEPYGDVFTMSNFSYLSDNHKMLANPYGSTNRSTAKSLQSVKTIDELITLEKNKGWTSYNQEQTKHFRDFLTQYIRNKNANNKNKWLNAIAPPRQFWTQGRGNEYTGQEPIISVIVEEVTTLFNGTELSEIRNLDLMEVKF